jgi:hypothetical protein
VTVVTQGLRNSFVTFSSNSCTLSHDHCCHLATIGTSLTTRDDRDLRRHPFRVGDSSLVTKIRDVAALEAHPDAG